MIARDERDSLRNAPNIGRTHERTPKSVMPKLPALVLTLVLGSVTAFAVAARPSASSTSTEFGGGKLGQHMETLQSNAQRFGKALDKKDDAAALTALMEMQTAAHLAKLETPPKAKELKDDAKQKEFVQGFRNEMIGLERALLDVEAALVSGKPDEAKKAFEEKVKPAKKEGHSKYKGD